jgi:hypothetical protein
MESIVQNVSDIQDGEKRCLENLLGQHLEDSQRVFIMVFTPGVIPDDETRRRAATSMDRTFAQTDAHARQQGITAAEADAAVEEAMNHVRTRRN